MWVGARAHDEYADGAHAWAVQLMRFEAAPPPIELAQGGETEAFWAMLGGEAAAASRLPKYDGDYGVGTTPTIGSANSPFHTPISAPVRGASSFKCDAHKVARACAARRACGVVSTTAS